MAKKTIAVDIDETLADHAEAFVVWSNEKYGTNLKPSDYQEHWSQLWLTEHEETERRATAFHEDRIHRDLVTKVDSFEVLGRLKQYYDLIIVTARRQLIVDDTKQWLQTNYPDIFSDVHFVPIWDRDSTLTKASICQEVGADYLIDDLLKHCSLVAECGLRAVLFGNYSWNASAALPERVVRADNWIEVERYFDEQRSTSV